MSTQYESGGTVIKDSGARRVFDSGAHRDRGEGKGAFHLLPFQGLLEVAQVFEAGGRKYTANNWRLGMPVEMYKPAIHAPHKLAYFINDQLGLGWSMGDCTISERMLEQASRGDLCGIQPYRVVPASGITWEALA